MALVQSDIKVFKSGNISDTSANGGVMTTVELADVVGALFPNVDNTERTSGSTKWRKIFFKLHNDGLLPLIGARLYQDQDTPGTDTILMAPVTTDFNETQTSIGGSPALYGALPIAYNLDVGDTQIDVNLPQGVSANFLVVGNTLRVTDKDVTTGIGNEEFTAITAVSASGSAITLTVSPPLTIAYSTTTGRVMNVLEHGDLYARANNLAVTSAAGTFDLSKLLFNNRSTISAIWTLTFTTSTNFTITSSTGITGAGNTATPVVLNNPSYSLPYLTIPTTAFGGNFLAGDTIIFTSVPAAIAVWLKRIVPAGATPIAVNKAIYVLDGGTV